MSDKPALKVGDVLVPIATSSWTAWGKVELVSSTTFKGAKYWWIKMTHNDGGTHLDTLSEDTLAKGWRVKVKFYEIGRTYKFPANRDDQWTILDIYQVDNPLSYGDYIKAVAKMVTPNGYESIETLTVNDFKRMIEVK